MTSHIGRREFITLAGGTAAAWPLAARAHQAALPEIGILNSISLGLLVDRLDAFLEGLEDTRFVIDRNVTVEYRSSEGRAELLPALAAELVRRNPAVILCLTSASTVRAARDATSTIPIVFAISGDPAALGLVANLQRPEANVTGAARVTEPLNPERLKVLCEVAPPQRPVAFLLNSNAVPAATTQERIREMEAVAHAAGHQLIVLDLAGRPDIVTIFANMARQGVGAFVISTEALFNVWRDQVISLSASHSIAAMFPNREYVLAGGLISYGADFYEHYRVAGTYVGRILKGETPADLPVQLPTKFEMVINLKTAKALGLTIPQTLLRDASEVIE
jgi:putative tryptophan/tyrosine transport system substrate-binding protein